MTIARVDAAGTILLSDGRRLDLEDFYSATGSNLRLYESGTEIWAADLKDPQVGRYVSAQTEGGRIFATTFDGFFVELDAATGAIIARRLTK